MKIERLTVENLQKGCVTDEKNPRFSFAFSSSKEGASLEGAILSMGDWQKAVKEQILVPYDGEPLQPFTDYTLTVEAEDNFGEKARESVTFSTGRMDTPWTAKWITCGSYYFKEKGVSPIPMTFRKILAVGKEVARAKIYVTAMGIYELSLNGEKVGSDYFAPGFTSYKNQLQYQTYDVTTAIKKDNQIDVVIAGGWAVGSFVWTRKNRVYADRQALLLELRIDYTDGTSEVVASDESWLVTMDGNYRFADIYDGETYDSTVDMESATWQNATVEKLKIRPQILAEYGAPVRAHEKMTPVSVNTLDSGEIIYDFGQNFAGVVFLKIKGKAGQKITVRHAEILKQDGSLFTEFLRSAKCTATYICKDGEQEYSPRLTYMGFRYISITGIDEGDIEVSAWALYSSVEQIGEFVCSSEKINKLQQNIIWSSKSNFMDIPTDCPQRDERMGWTGDIAVFARTACYNFDMSRFLEKWLKDLRSEQLKTGGIPNTIPVHGYGFPATMPVMAMAFWGDACILTPWAEYLARGDKELLRRNYDTMKKYVKACQFWAGLFSFGKQRYIWNTPAVFNFGDWVAPDLPTMGQWQARAKWTATASLRNTSMLLSKIAGILGEEGDEKKYGELSKKVADAYVSVFTDGNGKLLNEFQTAYVLPLEFDMFEGEAKKNAAKNLAELVEKNDYCVGTGFPGTPYILFALADNGYLDVAYKMLFNEKCPSWLYEVKAGATTVWERWDGLGEDGVCHIGDDGTAGVMISYNHYASGAVGDFLYRRALGIEPTTGGYKTFRVAPQLGGELTWAKGSVQTPYGKIAVDWKVENNALKIEVTVPANTTCELRFGKKFEYLKSGTHVREFAL